MTTVTVKTSELVGAALNYATLTAIGGEVDEELTHSGKVFGIYDDLSLSVEFDPQGSWSQCGPLIESAPIDLEWNGIDGKPIWWTAKHDDGSGVGEQGSTPLIAVCRAIVAAKLGDTVEVPEVLL